MADRLNKLGGTDWGEEGLKPTTDLVPTLNTIVTNDGIADAELAHRILQSNDIFTNGPNLVVDEFTDATGFKNTVDDDLSNADFVTDHYEVTNVITSDPFIIIEATSISSGADFAINNCKITPVAPGKWQLTCNTGTAAVRRAQLYKTLFYGTNGSNPRASATYITSITALKTNVSRDVGKKGYGASHTGARTDVGDQWTATFATTSGNTDVSMWDYWSNSGGTDNTGTDKESNEQDNPGTARLTGTAISKTFETPNNTTLETYSTSSGDVNITHRVIYLSAQTMTFSAGTWSQDYATDFNVDNSIPAFTATTETIKYQVVCNANTTTLDSNEKGFAIALPDTVFATSTSVNVNIRTNSNELTAQTISEASKGVQFGNDGTLTANTMQVIIGLVPSTTDTPEVYGYGVKIYR